MMKCLQKGIALMILVLIASLQTYAQSYYYVQSFESTNPLKFWTSNAKYQINYIGPSSDRAVDGTKSLKFDITVFGNGTAQCYYYWQLPVSVNLHGTMNFSAYLWMDSRTASMVKVGYSYNFPPTGLSQIPIPPNVTQYSTWFKQSTILSNDVIYHVDRIADTKIYGSTYDDFGRELQYVPIMIKATGQQRIVFYMDKVELSGNVPSQATYVSQYTSAWSKFQSRLSSIMTQKHNEYNALAPIPSTSGVTLTAKGQEYLSKLQKARTDMQNLFTQMDGKQFFAPELMTSLEDLLGSYPSWMEMLKIEMSSSSRLAVFKMPATLHNRLDGKNIPQYISQFDKLSLRACPGEFEPLSIFIQPRQAVNNVNISWTNFTGTSGSFASTALDVSIVKVWYQAGVKSTETTGKILTQELLLKNDALVKVDYSTQTNYLQVTNSTGVKQYINISSPSAVFPTGVTVLDSPTLLPFSLDGQTNRQLWFNVHVPDATPAGRYSTQVTISDAQGTIKTFPLEVEVLPFKLDQSKVTYGVYYHGFIDNYGYKPFGYTGKTTAQYKLEMQDLKDHGVLYPTTYQSIGSIGNDLTVRNQVGLPTDRLYSIGLQTSNPQTSTELSTLKSKVSEWKTKIAQYGYTKDFYCYGIDEASGDKLRSQRPAWTAVHEAGGKVFVAGYTTMYADMGDLLDQAVILGDLRPEQADMYHSRGHKIFSYSNPQIGQENPEIYRRNYGLALWKSGYDGAMNYAYQKFYTSAWNDFDYSAYREETFTYPASNGVIGTIQWEGFREGVDDVRYLSTLLNKVQALKSQGQDVTQLEQWINSLDLSQDPDLIRQQIIDKILSLNGYSAPSDITAPKVSSVTLVNTTTVKIAFSEKINSTDAVNKANYAINNGVVISAAALSSTQNEVTLTTSAHNLTTSYSVTVKNIKDLAGNSMGTTGTATAYKYAGEIAIRAERAVLANGAAFKTKSGSLGAKVAYCATTSSTITFTVNIPKTGTWYIWGRFFFEGSASLSSANSFFVRVDGGPQYRFGNNKDNYGKWHYGGDGMVEFGAPVKLSLGTLSAGTHKIIVSGREPGATVMLDAIVLTANASYIPTDLSVKPILTKVEDEEVVESQIPNKFELSQNYPNPFNPSTRIKYSLPENSEVSVKIYDMLGKEVAVLVNQQQNAGYYEVDFNGSHLASGMYIYQLRTKNYIETKKMMMIK